MKSLPLIMIVFLFAGMCFADEIAFEDTSYYENAREYYTDFEIDNPLICDLIEEIHGVESCFHEKKYTITIIKGRLFNWGDIDDAIRSTLSLERSMPWWHQYHHGIFIDPQIINKY